jgi:cytochrome d ubiquinol oxidase subunit I
MSAKAVSRYEPIKLAASEAHFDTASGVPLLVGGIPDPEAGEVRFALHIPKGLSFLATGDPDATIQGLHDFPRDEWPNVVLSHVAFQIMVACGFALLGLGLLYWFARWRRKEWRIVLFSLLLGSPLGFIALEAGWVVTEVGRQPWIVHGVMRTKDAVTHASGVDLTFFVFTVLYVVLAVALVLLLRYLAKKPYALMEAPHGG